MTAQRASPLAQFVSWSVPDQILIADPALLAVMKLRALPQHDKDQKRLKDLADLHALLWYGTDFTTIRAQVRDLATADEVETVADLTTDELVAAVSTLLQVDPALIRASIDRLTR